ncbi:MAG TPA: Spy/CpxP family protein refolding chaperone [Verrucomicrobiae bacterium]|nr:Spy/CpxP family protein refolding chaperone [Verrucomicrobiae bacterium]
MKRLTIALAVVALLAADAARAADETNRPAYGPGGPGGPGGPRFEMPLIPPRLMADLALTADQKTNVDAIAADFAQQRDKILADQKTNPTITKLRDEIKAAREARDREKMRELRAQLMPYEKPLLDLRRASMDKVRALLTDAQKKTLDNARERFGHRWGPPPPSGGPGNTDTPSGD